MEEPNRTMTDETFGLLSLLADIRKAVGDPTGKLMQDELVERCRELRNLESLNETYGIRIYARRIKDGWVIEDSGDNAKTNATLIPDP